MEARRLTSNPLTSFIFRCFQTGYHGSCLDIVDSIYDPNEKYIWFRNLKIQISTKNALLSHGVTLSTIPILDCTRHRWHGTRVDGLSLLQVFCKHSIHSTELYCSVIFKTSYTKALILQWYCCTFQSSFMLLETVNSDIRLDSQQISYYWREQGVASFISLF